MLFEIFKAALAGFTAALVFIVGQAIQRFIFEPVSDMRKLIGQIGIDLVFYRNRFSNPSATPLDEWIEASNAYRRHASSLRSLPCVIPFYDHIARVFSLPSKKDANAASSNLIGISNMSRDPERNDYEWKNEQFIAVHSLLKLPTD